jgi:hypothetical protein
MTLTSKGLQATDALMDEKLKSHNDCLEMLEIKQDLTTCKQEDINFRITSMKLTGKNNLQKSKIKLKNDCILRCQKYFAKTGII